MAEIFLVVITAILFLHYLIFLLKINFGLSRLKPADKISIKKSFISVIIPFRNEEENIVQNVLSLQKVEFPSDNFEIIYVDDHSIDNSVDLLKSKVSSDSIKIISVPDNYSPNAHKKRAIRFGIDNSQGDIIVTSDADCFYNKDWLNSLLGYFDESTGFVSGPVKFQSENKIFSQIQQIEFAGLVIVGAGLIGNGSPTICNAANIAFSKKAYKDVNGYNDNLNLSSGDDELLMQKIAASQKYKVQFSIDHDSFVETKSNKNLFEFYHQRKRWASKGLFYNSKLLILKLILIFLFFLSLIVLAVSAIWLGIELLYFSIVYFILKMTFEFRVLKKGKSVFFENLTLKYFIPAELLHIPYILVAGISGLFGNYLWKERIVKR